MHYKVGDKVYANFAYRVESGVIVGIKETKIFGWTVETKYIVEFDHYYHTDIRSKSELHGIIK